jgi:hypothetical protein
MPEIMPESSSSLDGSLASLGRHNERSSNESYVMRFDTSHSSAWMSVLALEPGGQKQVWVPLNEVSKEMPYRLVTVSYLKPGTQANN